MKFAVQLLILTGLMFAGCRTAKNVAVTSFRVVDTPARLLRERIDASEQPTTTTTTTTTTGPSDVANPGYAVTQPPPAPPTTRPRTTTQSRSPTSSTITQARPRPQTSPAEKRPSPAASPRASTPQTTQEFPTARPVPGRPGYVFSLDPNGGMIDVTGYKSGDKAKDPYTKQIFIVP